MSEKKRQFSWELYPELPIVESTKKPSAPLPEKKVILVGIDPYLLATSMKKGKKREN